MPPNNRVVDVQRRLLHWFRASGRGFPWRSVRSTKYQKVIAEVLLQRTRADVVGRMFPAFVSKYPSWTSLSEATQVELEDLLRPLGLWKRRAASIQSLARIMASRRGRFPKASSDVESLPGVGQYIRNAILMFDQGQRLPLLDVNFARVLERVFGPRKLSDIRYDSYLQELASRMVQNQEPLRMNWALLDFASLVCTIRSPKCETCSLKNICCYAQTVRGPVDFTILNARSR
jgi:A/G-specific adenine glycosylase